MVDKIQVKSKLKWHPTWNLETSLQKIVEWHKHWLSNSNMQDICLEEINQFIKDSNYGKN